jgi:hypothetical protein
LKVVDHTGRQRCLRPDNHQPDTFPLYGFRKRTDIGVFDIKVTGKPGGTGITRSGKYLGGMWTLRQLPDEGMLTGAAANDQYLQGLPPVVFAPVILSPVSPSP